MPLRYTEALLHYSPRSSKASSMTSLGKEELLKPNVILSLSMKVPIIQTLY
jgi:hypothetical protein